MMHISINILRKKELAAILGVSTSIISAYETTARKPSLDQLENLSDFFNVTTDFLLARESRRFIDIGNLTERQQIMIAEFISELSGLNGSTDNR